MNRLSTLSLIPLSLMMMACKNSASKENTVNNLFPTETQPFGTTSTGEDVKMFKLTNEAGMEANISEYGALLLSLYVPDKDGNSLDVTHGYDEFDFDSWENDSFYFGATIGRYGNRIKNGKIKLDDKDYQLAKNNNPGGIPCHLHGGIKGFNKVVWSGESLLKEDARGVRLTYISPNGEEGYPGTLTTVVTYWLTDSNELIWEVEAVTDQATPCNLIQHTYWNLSGDGETLINDHLVQINADHYLPTDGGMIPTGEIASVAETPMDFCKMISVGERIENDFKPLNIASGYDHCWVLKKQTDSKLTPAVICKDPKSGRTLTLFTTAPGLQFYTGNFLDGKTEGKLGIFYAARSALCFESGDFPDAPNQNHFPDTILKPQETYHHQTVYRFSW